LLQRDVGGEGLHGLELAVLGHQLCGERGGFVDLAQLQEGTTEGGASAGGGSDHQPLLPAGANGRGISPNQRQRGPRVEERRGFAAQSRDLIE
jgi:hypothetical protein